MRKYTVLALVAGLLALAPLPLAVGNDALYKGLAILYAPRTVEASFGGAASPPARPETRLNATMKALAPLNSQGILADG
jgi:hypothetical protein